jgi:hypothetical protein
MTRKANVPSKEKKILFCNLNTLCKNECDECKHMGENMLIGANNMPP